MLLRTSKQHKSDETIKRDNGHGIPRKQEAFSRRSQSQRDNRYRSHRDRADDADDVISGNVIQQRAVSIEKIVQRENVYIEEIAAKEIPHSHVDGTDTIGGIRHSQLRKRRRDCDKNTPDKGLCKPGFLGYLAANERQKDSRRDNQ